MTTKATSDYNVAAETVIRWDRTDEPATFYTADPSEMRRWRRLVYAVEVYGIRKGKPAGWRARVPIVGVALLPMRRGKVLVNRYLEVPVLSDRGPGLRPGCRWRVGAGKLARNC